ncbi:MAG: UDP-N-acetylmuramate dehydrogenase [Eubacteriales bacterium]|nr:UDP-N-acetylmuramate dehydrogenase [Eubacteriales bacterium]MDD3198637.1 UDP-N-acetylmuramate dehydrogenase [Eubacteriales bacterium]MDD3502807.1 UDP-N-acetylmuramate dehydrogenase [Eubacteriales bacterium]MDD4683192.1 UDP-N-acetylmuramate dehydrogenase [Eubacteriales bacterium]
MTDIYKNIETLFPSAGSRLLKDVIMSEYTTFRLGGPADCLFLPESIEELQILYSYAAERHLPITLLGRGSNVIVSDLGIRGVTVIISDNLSGTEFAEDTIIAQSGASLASVAGQAAQRSWSGLEFASGIPGTVGGGVMMNAGAYDGCLADSVIWTEYLDEHRYLRRIDNADHEFGYRRSFFTGSRKIIVRTAFRLKEGSKQEIFSKMADLASRRRSSQPLERPSAGSAFKRPAGFYAGKLISDCGLKGFQIGGAAVSDKHAGFIVNLGNATASDVLAVFCHVQQTVKKMTGVLLEPEVRFAGDWQSAIDELNSCHII